GALAAAALAVAVLAAACTAEPPATEAEAEAAMSVCADGPTVFGIDVSRFQGAIDWQQVAGAGVVFAYIQISRSVTDLDPRFDENWRRAKEVGILRGAYQRFHPGQDVPTQADIFLSRLGPFQAGDLPPMLDVEDADGLPAATIAARVRQWLDLVEPVVGVRPIIYTGFYFWRDQVGGADFSGYPLWIANYSATCPLVPPAWSRWTIHQYSSTAVLPGITANTVDVNKFNGTLEQLEALGRRDPVCAGGRCGFPEIVADRGDKLAHGDPAGADAGDVGCSTGAGARALVLTAWAYVFVRRRRRRG
ncbi:MAG TPA: GH25 family lysozyme, partial [Kofleriaceae bacterium]|nr:GH25 family lysozyme [Kofleriaceae bacterium]